MNLFDFLELPPFLSFVAVADRGLFKHLAPSPESQQSDLSDLCHLPKYGSRHLVRSSARFVLSFADSVPHLSFDPVEIGTGGAKNPVCSRPDSARAP